jgi:hypothetical protein
MLTAIAVILIAIFLFLSGLHIYWIMGGQWGLDAAIPTQDNQVKLFTPGILATLVVSTGLAGFGFIVFLNTPGIDLQIPFGLDFIRQYGLWAIVVIFTLRAIGDFNYVGFFKKHRQTKFGRNDTRYYASLCLAIAILSFFLTWCK